MKTAEILLIALGLSLDAFAVAVASGATMKRLHVPRALKMGLFFGGFQALMPVLGWAAGLWLRDLVSGIGPWLAFALLCGVGGRMVYEAREIKDEEDCGDGACPFDTGTLTVLALATRLDALAVGLSFSALDVAIVAPALVIGLVTFLMSVAGVRLGAAGGHFFEHRMETAGGVILIAIGLKVLLGGLGLLRF